MAPDNTSSKKRKGTTTSTVGQQKTKKEQRQAERDTFHKEVGYSAMTLEDLRTRVQDLCRRIPSIPEDCFILEDGKVKWTSDEQSTMPQAKTPCRYDKPQIRKWAESVQSALEEFNLLVACVSAVTYKWGTDRSGAADQHLSLLSAEFIRSQEQLLARVTPRLNDVLAPVMSMLTDKTVMRKEVVVNKDGKEATIETKQNFYVTTEEDPDYCQMCYGILARNAPLLRHVVLANLEKVTLTITDYLDAQHKDSQADSRSFVY